MLYRWTLESVLDTIDLYYTKIFTGRQAGRMVDETRDEMTVERAMVVVAHADDAEFGCSGTVAKWCAEVIWISDINEDSLERTMFSFELLQKYGMSVKILLNNRSNERKRELIEYHWLTLEEELSTTIQGLVPYIRGKNRVERVTEVLADIFDENWLEQRDA